MKASILYKYSWPFMIFIVLCACGCEQKQSPLVSVKRKITQAGPEEKTLSPKTNLPEQKGTPVASSEDMSISYQYDPIGKRDPFKTFLQLKPETESAKREDKFLTPLQRYDLDQLRIVGIVFGAGSQYALVEDDTGKGYSVRVGDIIGSKGGRVIGIQKDRIIVEEEQQDYLGNRQMKRIEKRLYTPVEGENP